MNRAISLLFCAVISYPAFSQTYRDVKPIFSNKCVSCHNKDGGAPFSLETYEAIKKRTSFIQRVIQSNYMPPWRADAHFREFGNNRSLSQEEKSKILQWIGLNAPKGLDVKGEESKSKTTSNQPALRRTPDLICKIKTPYLVKGDNQERFLSFKVPIELSETKNIEGIEFYSNNKKIIHHVNYGFYEVADKSIDIYAGSAVIDPAIDTSFAAISQYEKLKKTMRYYSGWIPGASYEYYPKNFGWVLPKRGVVIFTVHYSAIAADEKSTIGVNLFFKKQAIEREVKIISLGSGGIGERDISPPFMIAPGKISTFSLKVRTQETQSILYVWPHMHYLGKEFYAYAVSPSNDTIKLVHIPSWDFRWQELYRMNKLVKVPAGSVINIIGSYDNTANNPLNPNNPPKFVFSSGDMRSSDEMLTLLLIYLPYKDGDEKMGLE